MAKQRHPIALSGVLRTAVGVVDAPWRRFSALDGSSESGERQADVDRAAEGIADRLARPGVEDHRDVGEALPDGDVCYICDPELVRSINHHVFGPIGIDRLVMVAVGRGYISATPARLKVVFAHEPTDLLMVDDHPSMPKLGANAPPTVEFEFLADRGDRLDDRCVVLRSGFVVEGRAGDSHQPAAFCDAETRGPTTTDVVALFGRGALFTAPFRNSSSSACLPTRRSSAAIRASYCWSRSAAAASSS